MPERDTMAGSLVNVSYICTDKSGFTMKIKINWLLIIALIALVFCVSYLVSHLIIKELYIDAVFVVAIVVLFPLLVYSIRRGK